MSNDNTESRIVVGRKDFHAALRETLAQAVQAGSRELVFSDADFADWPLGDRDFVEMLDQWAATRRSYTMLARHYDAVTARHARFVQWRRQWSHLIQCRACAEIDADDWPAALLVPGLACVRLHDRVRVRAVVSSEPADLVQAAEAIDAVLQRSVEAFPASTLGL